MGQFKFLGLHESELRLGHPDPSIVSPGDAFTVDDEVDEAYSAAPELYEVVRSTWTPPAPAEEDLVVPGPLRRETPDGPHTLPGAPPSSSTPSSPTPPSSSFPTSSSTTFTPPPASPSPAPTPES